MEISKVTASIKCLPSQPVGFGSRIGYKRHLMWHSMQDQLINPANVSKVVVAALTKFCNNSILKDTKDHEGISGYGDERIVNSPFAD